MKVLNDSILSGPSRLAPLTTRPRLALMSTHTTGSVWPVKMASGATELSRERERERERGEREREREGGGGGGRDSE